MEPIITWQLIIIIIIVVIIIIIIIIIKLVFILVQLVVDSNMYCRVQVTPINNWSEECPFSKQCSFLKKSFMLLFKSNSFNQFFNLFDCILRAIRTTVFRDKLQISFASCLDHCNCLSFPVFSAQLLYLDSNIQKGDTLYKFCTAQLYHIFCVELCSQVID